MGGPGCKKVSPYHFYFEGDHVRRSPIFHPNSSEEQKKGHPQKKKAVTWAKTPKNFRVNMI